MKLRRGEIWIADLPEPIGSEPGFRRPFLIVQSNQFNETRLNTVIVIAFTTNLKLADADGNMLLLAEDTGLNKDSVLNFTQLVSVDKLRLVKHVGKLSPEIMEKVNESLRLILSL